MITQPREVVPARRISGWVVLAVFVLPLFIVAPVIVVYIIYQFSWKTLLPLVGIRYTEWTVPGTVKTTTELITFLILGLVASVLWHRLTGKLRFWQPLLFVLLAATIYYIEFVVLMSLARN